MHFTSRQVILVAKRLEDLAAELEANDLTPEDIQRIKQEIEELRNFHVPKDEAEEFVRSSGSLVITNGDLIQDTLPYELKDKLMPRRRFRSIRMGGYAVGLVVGVLCYSGILHMEKLDYARQVRARVERIGDLESEADYLQQRILDLTRAWNEESTELATVQSSLETCMVAWNALHGRDTSITPSYLEDDTVRAAWPSVLARISSRECYYIKESDIYQLNLATGESRQLTRSAHRERSPVSNGATVFYVYSEFYDGWNDYTQNSICAINRDGTNRRLLQTVWSPVDNKVEAVTAGLQTTQNLFAFYYGGIWYQGQQDMVEVSHVNYHFNHRNLNDVVLSGEPDGIYLTAPQLFAPVRVLEQEGITEVSW